MPARKRPTNARPAPGISTSDPKAASWDALDRLPRAVREVLWSAPLPINPISAENLLDMGGERQAAGALHDAIGREVEMFAEEHRKRFGYDLPHIAAGVTMQGYASRLCARIPRRHPRCG